MSVRRFAVIGSPIGHSLSPALHTAAHRAAGLTDVSYERRDVDTETFASFLAELGPEWRGLSVTMPCKAPALAAASAASDLARLTGAANTLVRRPDGGWDADNTDVPGLVAAFRAAGARDVTSGAVIGSGATAASAVVALARLGARTVTVHARSAEKARALVPIAEASGARLDVRTPIGPAALAADAIVSTVPAPSSAAVADALTGGFAAEDRPDAGEGHDRILLDALYDPWPTPIARSAADHGLRVLSGLDLLLFQAVEQVRQMTGCTPDVAAMAAELRSERPEWTGVNRSGGRR